MSGGVGNKNGGEGGISQCGPTACASEIRIVHLRRGTDHSAGSSTVLMLPLRVADEQDDTAQHKKCFVRFVKAYVCGVWCSNLFSFSREAADTSGQGWHTLGRGSQSKVVWRGGQSTACSVRKDHCRQRSRIRCQTSVKHPLNPQHDHGRSSPARHMHSSTRRHVHTSANRRVPILNPKERACVR